MKNELARRLSTCAGEIARTAGLLAVRGWAEANAGNISQRIESEPIAGRERPMAPRKRLAGRSLVIKRAGARMRDIAAEPLAGLCLVQVNAAGTGFRVLPEDAVPSTELPSHLAAHETLLRSRPEDRAVLHTHPTALIALSLLVPVPRELVALLARMHSEGPIFVQDRVSAIPFHPPSTEELAKATAASLRRTPGVIWPCHGMMATGTGPAEALDLVELVDKAATIALLLGERRMLTAGLTFAQEMAVREAFGLD